MKIQTIAAVSILLTLCSCLKHELQAGLSEQESQEIIVLLEEHGLHALRKPAAAAKGQEKGEPAWVVYVQGGGQELVEAWRILQENGLPRERLKGLDQVYANSGMIPTAGEEKARMLTGLAGELSHTLRSVPGVVDARVHVVMPENSPLLDKAQWSPTTASVLVKYNANQPPLSEEQVRKLVSKGIEGLQPENVGVVYQQIVPKPPASRDYRWFLGNELILMATLLVAVLSSIGALALAIQSRLQRNKIRELREQLETATATASK